MDEFSPYRYISYIDSVAAARHTSSAVPASLRANAPMQCATFSTCCRRWENGVG
jgi:hypothetical protein